MNFSLTLKWVIYLSITAFCMRLFLFSVYKIENNYMSPNFKSSNIVIVWKWSYGFRFPWSEKTYFKSQALTHDVVAVDYPKQPGIVFLKRIIAGPNKKFSIKNGLIFVDDQPIVLPASEVGFPITYQVGDTVLSDNQYLVVFDNRDFEVETSQYGVIESRQIIGRQILNLNRLFGLFN